METLTPVMQAAADMNPLNTGRDKKLRTKPRRNMPTSRLMTPTRNVMAAMYWIRSPMSSVSSAGGSVTTGQHHPSIPDTPHPVVLSTGLRITS